jgi:dUTP pyrophosphatase
MTEEAKQTCNYCDQCPTVEFARENDDAVIPHRAYPADIGYDLTAIGVFKKIGENITLWETGISVQPPQGYYLEILPRSSLSETGYMLSNSVGTIDPDYTGTLKIALTKVDHTRPDLQLPFTKCQLVLRKANHYNIAEVDSHRETVRGDGGFGSTDNAVINMV